LAMTLDSQTSPALGSLYSRCQLVFTHAGPVSTSVAKPIMTSQVHKDLGESWKEVIVVRHRSDQFGKSLSKLQSN